jgi:hypothetical protein
MREISSKAGEGVSSSSRMVEGEVSYVKAERESTRLMEVRLVDVLVARILVVATMGTGSWSVGTGTGLGDSCLEVG